MKCDAKHHFIENVGLTPLAYRTGGRRPDVVPVARIYELRQAVGVAQPRIQVRRPEKPPHRAAFFASKKRTPPVDPFLERLARLT
jgi:hypothetical protein